MYKFIIRLLILILFFTTVQVGSLRAEFLFFDLITAEGKPKNLPMEKMHMIYQWPAYGGQYTSNAKKDYNSIPGPYLECCYVKNNIVGKIPEYVSIDFEQWDLLRVDENEFKTNEYKIINSLERVRKIFPNNTKISFYNVGVFNSFNFYQNKMNNMDYLKWKKMNDKLNNIIEKMDFLQPSLYFQSKYSFEEWEKKSIAFITESKRVADGKPIFMHISPQYMDKEGEFVPLDIWVKALNFAYNNADGLVVWTFPQERYRFKWDDKIEWWNALLELLQYKQHVQ